MWVEKRECCQKLRSTGFSHYPHFSASFERNGPMKWWNTFKYISNIRCAKNASVAISRCIYKKKKRKSSTKRHRQTLDITHSIEWLCEHLIYINHNWTVLPNMVIFSAFLPRSFNRPESFISCNSLPVTTGFHITVRLMDEYGVICYAQVIFVILHQIAGKLLLPFLRNECISNSVLMECMWRL